MLKIEVNNYNILREKYTKFEIYYSLHWNVFIIKIILF